MRSLICGSHVNSVIMSIVYLLLVDFIYLQCLINRFNMTNLTFVHCFTCTLFLQLYLLLFIFLKCL